MKGKSLFNLLRMLGLALVLGILCLNPAADVEAQGPAPGELVLWNKLGSQAEIENSGVGPDGTIYGSGISFVPGQFGNGFTSGANVTGPNFGPWIDINPDYDQAGTIEFWWQPAKDYDATYRPDETFSSGVWAPQPWAPIALMYRWSDVEIGGFEFLIHGAERYYRTGQVVPFQAGDWVHVAYVWDTVQGLPNDPNVYYGVYINGQYYPLTDAHDPNANIDAVMIKDNDFYFSMGFYTADSLNQFNGVLDNIKIWDYAKTDFSDRFEEGPELVANPVDTDIYPGDTVNVDLNIQGADNLYGLQTTCAVDPAVLAPQSATFGDFFSDPLVGANTVDAGAGTWFGGVSLKNPADPLSGDGLFATLTYEALVPGSTTITCDPLASDEDGFELPIGVSGETLTVLEYGAISGTATYQGRLDHTAIDVTATGPADGSTQTDSSGQFELTALKGGSYAVQADAPLYLPNCLDTTVTSAQTTVLTGTVLRGGDVKNNDKIKIGDATLVTANFGLAVADGADPNTDINADGQVNVQDLSILGRNFGLEGCQAW